MNDDFDKWCGQWDNAQKSGIFKKREEHPIPSSQTAKVNFFGQADTNPSVMSDCDAKYWNSVHELSKYYDINNPKVIDDIMNEEIAVDTKKYTKSMAYSPNPIHPASVGMDQDITNPVSMGATYDTKDIQNLENLKVKLHDLLGKLSSLECKAESNAKLEGQILALRKQIDEFSDGLSVSIPTSQGD